jgi:hypothetical protein
MLHRSDSMCEASKVRELVSKAMAAAVIGCDLMTRPELLNACFEGDARANKGASLVHLSG